MTDTTAGPGRAFRVIERVGNRVPHPFLLFWYLLIALGAGSAVLTATHASSLLPGAKTAQPVRNILSVAGLQHLLTTFVATFIGFPPLGVVLAVLLGVGVAEQAGFLRTAVAATLARVPRRMMPLDVTFVAGQGHVMGGLRLVEAARDSGIASDDATALMRRVQRHGGAATYTAIGPELAGPHHTATFDFDEAALAGGVDLLERVARDA